MLYRTRLKLFLFLGIALLVSAGQAQGQWIPQGTNYYNPSDETLNLPSVYVLPPSFNPTQAPQYLFNARLKSQGDNIFELMSVDELLPEQECSRAEVLNAIPELRLDMTVDEGNALIGCTATISRGHADLETGVLVNASWTGVDGVPHNSTPAFFNPFSPVISLPSSVLVGSGGDWRPVPFLSSNGFISSSNPSLSLTLTSSNFGSSGVSVFGAPYITLALRENVVESYTYSMAGTTDGFPRVGCGGLQASFSQLNAGDTFQELKAKLACDGLPNRVTVSSVGEQQDYQWQYVSPQDISPQYVSPGAVSPGSASMNSRQSQTVSVTFLNDIAQSLQFRSSETYPAERECTIEELSAAEQNVQVGDIITAADLLACGTRSESVFDDGNTKQVTAIWQTNIANSSIYTSENRQLLVLLRDGIVTWVQLSRF